jgi:hypothetical protein
MVRGRRRGGGQVAGAMGGIGGAIQLQRPLHGLTRDPSHARVTLATTCTGERELVHQPIATSII